MLTRDAPGLWPHRARGQGGISTELSYRPESLMLDNSHKSELMFATRFLNSKGTRLLDDRQGLAPTES